MKIILSNVIQIEEPTKEILDYCKKELTYPNPDYTKRKQMNFWVGNIPKTIKLYDIYDDKLYVPYGFFEKLWKIHPLKIDYVDYTTSVYANIESTMTLRDYQTPCLRAIEEHYSGIFNVIVGLGKTNMALHCASVLKQKTLWITHSGDLLQQSKERAENNLHCTTSTITEGKCDTSGDIVFATIQTLIKFIEKGTIRQDTFGMTITDELHRVSCNPKSIQMFRTCIEYFSARYRLGLTGSLWRSDGLENCIKDIVGNPIYSIYQKDDVYICEYDGKIIKTFSSRLYSVKPRIKVIETKYNIIDKDVYSANGGTIQFATLISDLAMNKERNELILKHLRKMKGATIILSDRVGQLEYLSSKIEDSVLITGDTSKKDRLIRLNQVRRGEKKYLFGTYQLAKEGLDVTNLANLVMATPVKAQSNVIQSIGRIMRICDGKKSATVYDFVDDVSMLYRFYSKRRATYRKNNWIIDNMYLGGK